MFLNIIFSSVMLFVRRREKHALVEYVKEHENLTRQIHMLQYVV